MKNRIVTLGGVLLVSLAAAFLIARADDVTEVRVNTAGLGTNHREASIARRPADTDFENGVLCAAWVESTPGNGSLRYGYSRTGGLTWIDGGSLSTDPSDDATFDPDVAFRLLDKKFYITGHDFFNHLRGIEVHISANCQPSTFARVDIYRPAPIPTPTPPGGENFGGGDDPIPDKPMMTINNWAGAAGNPRDESKHHDRIYVTADMKTVPRTLAIWTSDNGQDWSAPVEPYPANYDKQFGLHGSWPTTAPSGRLYVAWVRYQDVYDLGRIDIQISRSTDGGQTFQMDASPLTGGRNPHTPGEACGPALKGSVWLVPSPQIEADDLGNVHMVYIAGDPDNTADHSNVYYTRGVPGADGGDLIWSEPLRLNTDTGTDDQFMPSLMVAKGSQKVAVYWYDRRIPTDDQAHPRFQIYRRLSTNRGAPGSWGSNILVSDAISPPPSKHGASCDSLGEYNRGIADPYNLYMLWGDRRTQGTSNNTNVFFERVNIAGVCTVSYCAGEGTRCSNTGSSETCCAYQSVEDPTCTGPDLVPANACPCGLLQ